MWFMDLAYPRLFIPKFLATRFYAGRFAAAISVRFIISLSCGRISGPLAISGIWLNEA